LNLISTLRAYFDTRELLSIALMAVWAYQEIARINALSNEELITELHRAMDGDSYSWQSINQRMGELEIDYGLYDTWNIIWKKKRDWEKRAEQDRPFSAGDELAKLSRADLCQHRLVLINMKVTPIFAGLWAEGTV
jgi:hypothetical protein